MSSSVRGATSRFTAAGDRQPYRALSTSMSACMRALYSSDQCAPGLSFAFFSACGMAGALPGSVDLRAPTLSLSVGRVEGGEIDSLMR